METPGFAGDAGPADDEQPGGGGGEDADEVLDEATDALETLLFVGQQAAAAAGDDVFGEAGPTGGVPPPGHLKAVAFMERSWSSDRESTASERPEASREASPQQQQQQLGVENTLQQEFALIDTGFSLVKVMEMDIERRVCRVVSARQGVAHSSI